MFEQSFWQDPPNPCYPYLFDIKLIRIHVGIVTVFNYALEDDDVCR